ncbi:hypothetical protein HY620_02425 [Candidatus Uhrbacteria bacterium]|nr:hypothetical protein [Candidatus Uhrbacteria bacterium]
MPARSKPTARQRYTSRRDMESLGREEFFHEEAPTRDTCTLEKYIHPTVSLLREGEEGRGEQIIRTLLDSPYQSVVVIDENAKPQQIITLQDILEAAVRLTPTSTIPLLIHDQREHFSAIEKDRILEVLEHFYRSFHERTPIYRITVSFEESRTRVKTVKAIQTTLKVMLRSGKVCIAKAERHDAQLAFREVLAEVKSKLFRLHERENNILRS